MEAELTQRIADHPIDPMFTARWSPRAFDGSAISDEELMRLFEAARWAPSAFNYQPWHFLYAHRGDAHWGAFLGGLVPFNQSWAKDASVLIYVASDKYMQKGPDAEPSPNHSHSFDAGAAWALLALQASQQGLAAHGMTGVDFDAASAALALPDRYRLEAAIAVGRPTDASVLPEGLREREVPSGRKSVGEFIRHGAFG